MRPKTDLPEDTLSRTPKIHKTAFIAKGAVVLGDVELHADASIWYNSVLRADINKIVIGERSNIQDGTIVHLENDRACIVGKDVTVGHRAILHGCTIEDGVLIGMGAIVLNGAFIAKGCVVAAGAVIKENTHTKPNTLWAGVPAKEVKVLSEKSYEENVKWAKKYVEITALHKEKFGAADCF